jgi:hypothetical protein
VPRRRGRAGIARPCAPGGVAAAKPRTRRCGRGRRLTIASAGRPAARDQGAAPRRRPGAAATVTGASWRARRLVAVPISSLHRCQQWDGMVGGLGLSQQVEQHGAHDRGDHREQDHQQAARPSAQRADLDSSRSHGLAPSTNEDPGVAPPSPPPPPRRQPSARTWCAGAGGSGRRGLECSAWRFGRGPGRAPGSCPWPCRRRCWLPLGRPACRGPGPPGRSL